ncbi:MAG: hypothetical protein JF603_01705 [Acidobacteria bacterium]|nr:hypothetical protein [Acidobacteriota bacterium]
MDTRERGSIMPLVAVLVVAMGGLCLQLGRFGGRLDDAARAQTAADAAALAGAADGRRAATELAQANHGDLVAYRQSGSKVAVRVQVGDSVARATAVAVPRFAPATLTPRSPGSGR